MSEGGTIESLTLEEALEIAARKPPIDYPSSRNKETGWAGVTFEEAMEKARHGDDIVALDLNRRLGQMAGIRTGNRATQRWGVAGSSVDMGRYLVGEPENMIETVRVRKPQPVMKLAIERAVSAFVDQETIRTTGASVLAVVEALRTAGVGAEIWATFTIKGANRLSAKSTQVLIQETGRPIDIGVLAFWVANPGALRRIAFAIWEQWSVTDRRAYNIGGNYGYPTNVFGDFDEIAPAFASQATAWMRDVLMRRAGVTMLDDHDQFD